MVCELPKGVALTGRLIDASTGRPVRAQEVLFIKLPTNRNEGRASQGAGSAGDRTFRLTVPPGGGMLLARACGQETPYTRARLRNADKGMGIGGPGDGETTTTIMHGHHADRIIDIPADAKNLPNGRRGVWPDDTTFTTDSDGRFHVDGLKPGVRSSIGVKAKIRANYRLDTGRVFRDIVLKKFGEVRDLGDIKVRFVPSNQ
jgi:hypothetical protein